LANKAKNSQIFSVVDAQKQPVEKIYLNCRNIVFLAVGKKSLVDFQGLEIKCEDETVLVNYIAREKKMEIITFSEKVVLQVYDRFLKKLIDTIELEAAIMPIPAIVVKDNTPKPRKEQLVFHIKIENDKKFSAIAPQDDEIFCNSLIYFMNNEGKYVAEKKIFLTKKAKNEYLLYVPIQLNTTYNKVIVFLSDFTRLNYKKHRTSFSHDFSETLTLE
jgi:hypothetical protein